MEDPNGNGAPPRPEGKYVAVFVCWLLGNGCLFPWNSMLTIEDYYLYLFPRYHPTRVLTLVYRPFAFVTITMLAYNEANINTRWRNLSGYILFPTASLAVLVDLATSGRGGLGTFIGICIIAAAFGISDAHVQGGMVGDLSFMQPELVQAFLAGLAASGALTSTLRIITKAVFENSKNGLRKGASPFKLSISVPNSLKGEGGRLFCSMPYLHFTKVCVALYALVFPKLPIVKYYRTKAAAEGSKTVSADLAAGGVRKSTAAAENDEQVTRLRNRQLLVLNFDYAVALFSTYWLTLSIFPGFLAEDTGTHGLRSWYALVLIAMFNVWDLIRRCLPLLRVLKLESRKIIALVAASRFLLVPCFYFTATYGGQGWMIMLTSFLGKTSGYLTVCILTSAPKGYKVPEQNALGNILVLFLLGGICAGVTSDWL